MDSSSPEFLSITNSVANDLIELMTKKYEPYANQVNMSFSDYILQVTTIFVLISTRNSALCIAEKLPKEDIKKIYLDYFKETLETIYLNGKDIKISRDEIPDGRKLQ